MCKGLGYLENFKQLSYVEIYSDSNFSNEAIQRLYEQLPNLYRLNLNGSDKQPSGMGVGDQTPEQSAGQVPPRQTRPTTSRRR